METKIILTILFIMNIFSFVYSLYIGTKINKNQPINKEPIKKLKRGLINASKETTIGKESIKYTLEVSIIDESDTKYKIQINNIIFNRSDHFIHEQNILDLDNNRWIHKKDVELIIEPKVVVRKEKISKLLEDDKE